jgi:hypothetical protein
MSRKLLIAAAAAALIILLAIRGITRRVVLETRKTEEAAAV